MLLITISLCYVIALRALAGGTLSTSTLEWIFSASVFLCLVQDVPALPVCRVFVATATVLYGVNPLEHDVPPKSRCRISTAVVLIEEIDCLSWLSPQQLYLTARPVLTILAGMES